MSLFEVEIDPTIKLPNILRMGGRADETKHKEKNKLCLIKPGLLDLLVMCDHFCKLKHRQKAQLSAWV